MNTDGAAKRDRSEWHCESFTSLLGEQVGLTHVGRFFVICRRARTGVVNNAVLG